MKGLFRSLTASPSFNRLLQAASDGERLLVSGLVDPAQDLAAAGAAFLLDRPLVILTANEVSARNAQENMSYLAPGGTFYFPAKDPLFYSADVRGDAIEEERLRCLKALRENRVRVLVLSVEAAFDRMLPKAEFEKMFLHFRVGGTAETGTLAREMIRRGYDRKDQVEHAGQFAIRGGIIDLFPMTSSQAYRMELWGDEIDSIRLLDPETQRSDQRVVSLIVDPAREIIVDEQREAEGLKQISRETERAAKAFERKHDPEAADRIREVTASLLYRLGGDNATALDAYLPYFYEDSACILDYCPDNALIVLKEPARIREKVRSFGQEVAESFSGRMAKGYLLPTQQEIFPDFSFIEQKLDHFSVLLFCSLLSAGQQIVPVREMLSFSSRSASLLLTNPNEMLAEIRSQLEDGYRVVILTDSALRIPVMVNFFTESGLAVRALGEDDEPQPGTVSIVRGLLKEGVALPDARLLLCPQQETTLKSRKKRVHRHFKNGTPIGSFADLSVGDFVVHETHGVGIFQGIVQLEREGTSRDYFRIAYRDGGTLYVPTTSLDLLQKYVGGEDAKPKVNRLGGQEWNRTKNKVRESVARLAENLVALYAERSARKGFSFGPDTVWQKEFEDSFPYQETDDQLNAIADTKRDMESDRIMDRLICGDVGYGKTEIAIRAAFKAVQDGKQVAMLAPTTVLAQQHYNTFTARMKDYPIHMGLLSRFRTPAQMSETIKGVRTGAVDILIGTHRMLSKDIQFKNLGLLIVDEEQRFGVGHKERIKEIQKNVDVLTLTATPIPRTLHMSLSGIREMSVLEEPPQERHPIQTFVMEEDEELIREAIYREMGRGGQVFFLYNRVQGIASQAARLQKLVPEARIAFGHGQMSEHELENVMLEFVEGEIDVLVCTTIIETGLDIPNANTIIIMDADRMGLAQLYQLRGRVGRSDRIAFAYFMYQKNKVLQETAQKRLEAIGEFTEFGSGFRIAKRDLQIRGAGNILGAQQHGHMGAVGYELYCKMLKEAMDQLNHVPSQASFETTIHISVDAFIPKSYIPNEAQKLEVYKKIALISDEEDYLAMQEELLDRYSEMPRAVGNLLDISFLKTLAHALGIDLVEENQTVLSLHFRSDAPIDPSKLFSLSMRWPGSRMIPKDNALTLQVPLDLKKGDKESKKILAIRKVLEMLGETKRDAEEKS